MANKNITLAFLHSVPGDPWLNRLTSRVCKYPVCHVELIFDWHVVPGSSLRLALSIRDGEVLWMKGKTFANPHYEYVTLSVSPKEYDATYAFAVNAVSHSLTFDNTGMVASIFHPELCAPMHSLHRGKTFCSKIITEALQVRGFFPGIFCFVCFFTDILHHPQFGGVREVESACPSAMTPSTLYERVHNSPRVVPPCIRQRFDTLPSTLRI